MVYPDPNKDQRYPWDSSTPNTPGVNSGPTMPSYLQGTAPTMPGGGWVDKATADTMATNPEVAYAMLRVAQGKTGRDKSIFGGKRASIYGQALQSLLNLGGDTSVGGVNALLGQVAGALNGGGDIGGMLRQAGQSAMGQDFSGMDDIDIQKVLHAISGAAQYDMSPLWSGQVQGPMDDIDLGVLQHAGSGGEGYFDNAAPQNSPFWSAIQKLLGPTAGR